MVSDLFFYQLGLIALVWLCYMLGSDIHVMLAHCFRVTVDPKTLTNPREVNRSHDH